MHRHVLASVAGATIEGIGFTMQTLCIGPGCFGWRREVEDTRRWALIKEA